MQNMTSKNSNKVAKLPHLKIIRTVEDHQQAMDRVLKLMKLNPPRGSQELDELEVLVLLVEQYEKKHFPMDIPDPVEVIKFMMDEQGLKRKDLIRYIGSASKVTEVLNGTRNLSLNMIRRLSEGLNIPASTLIQPSVKKRA